MSVGLTVAEYKRRFREQRLELATPLSRAYIYIGTYFRRVLRDTFDPPVTTVRGVLGLFRDLDDEHAVSRLKRLFQNERANEVVPVVDEENNRSAREFRARVLRGLPGKTSARNRRRAERIPLVYHIQDINLAAYNSVLNLVKFAAQNPRLVGRRLSEDMPRLRDVRARSSRARTLAEKFCSGIASQTDCGLCAGGGCEWAAGLCRPAAGARGYGFDGRGGLRGQNAHKNADERKRGEGARDEYRDGWRVPGEVDRVDVVDVDDEPYSGSESESGESSDSDSDPDAGGKAAKASAKPRRRPAALLMGLGGLAIDLAPVEDADGGGDGGAGGAGGAGAAAAPRRSTRKVVPRKRV